MCKVLLFVDMEFQGVGGTKRKNHGNSRGGGGGGSTMKPLEWKILGGGWGIKLEKTLRGGYGYFLEPHIWEKN